MSERMTACSGPGIAGIANYGRHTRAEMITRYRSFYQRQLAEAEKALAVSDDELVVETYLGPWARKNTEEVTD